MKTLTKKSWLYKNNNCENSVYIQINKKQIINTLDSISVLWLIGTCGNINIEYYKYTTINRPLKLHSYPIY